MYVYHSIELGGGRGKNESQSQQLLLRCMWKKILAQSPLNTNTGKFDYGSIRELAILEAVVIL